MRRLLDLRRSPVVRVLAAAGRLAADTCGATRSLCRKVRLVSGHPTVGRALRRAILVSLIGLALFRVCYFVLLPGADPTLVWGSPRLW